MVVWRINAFMQMPSVLTRRDYEDSLVTFYFGRGPDYLSLCQKHAYRDLQRTLHGIGKQQFVREKAQKEAHAIIACLSDMGIAQNTAALATTAQISPAFFDMMFPFWIVEL
jgi:hypothetical protein